MNLFYAVCWIRDEHRFQLPEGDTDNVDVEHWVCETCGKDFLTQIGEMKGVSREQARKYFFDPILNPPTTVHVGIDKASGPDKTVVFIREPLTSNKKPVKNAWWR